MRYILSLFVEDFEAFDRWCEHWGSYAFIIVVITSVLVHIGLELMQ